MYIVGEIENNGNETAQFVNVIATFYNQNGTVVAADFTYTNPYDIEPGQKAPFQIILTEEDRIALVNSYELTAESNQYALIPEVWAISTIVILLIAMGAIRIALKKHLNVPKIKQ
jgi:hypothetical protein